MSQAPVIQRSSSIQLFEEGLDCWVKSFARTKSGATRDFQKCHRHSGLSRRDRCCGAGRPTPDDDHIHRLRVARAQSA
jgi:hypothetical protein